MEEAKFTLEDIKRAVLVGYHACQYTLAENFRTNLQEIEAAMKETLKNEDAVAQLLRNIANERAYDVVPVIDIDLVYVGDLKPEECDG